MSDNELLNEGRYILNFDLISGFNNHSVSEENSSWNLWKWLRPPDKGLKYTSRLQWLISPNSMWPCPVVFFMMMVWWLASSRHNTHAKSQDLANKCATLLASRKTSFQSVGYRWSVVKFLLFWACVASTSCQGFLGISALLEVILFYLFYLYFPNHYIWMYN